MMRPGASPIEALSARQAVLDGKIAMSEARRCAIPRNRITMAAQEQPAHAR
jgi:hypothetical protein